MSALSTWLHDDDAPKWTFWVTDFRSTLAYAVSDLGGALARLGRRIHPDVAGDYHDGFAAGENMARLWAARRKPTREDVRALFDRIGYPSDDETLAEWGWPADV